MSQSPKGKVTLPKDVDNFQACLSWAFTCSLEAIRGISRDHPGAHNKIDDGGSQLFSALTKTPSECTEPARSVASITHYCLRELVDELAQKEDPRRAVTVLDSLNEDMVSSLFALVIQIVRLTSSPSEAVSNKAKALVEAIESKGCATWLDAATAENFPGAAAMLEDWDPELSKAILPG